MLINLDNLAAIYIADEQRVAVGLATQHSDFGAIAISSY
jgi:hypothetical protein